MKVHLRVALLTALIVSVSLSVASYSTKSHVATPAPALGIEIALAKPFYVPAATDNKLMQVVVRVPSTETTSPEAVSAVKLEPRMDGDKVRVDVFALVGPTTNIKTCKDWDALKSTRVATYVAAVDEEVSLTKLQEFGISMATDPLTFRVVPKRTLSPVPQTQTEGGCGCGSCGGLICCPNPGHCLGCGECGDVCCSSN